MKTHNVRSKISTLFLLLHSQEESFEADIWVIVDTNQVTHVGNIGQIASRFRALDKKLQNFGLFSRKSMFLLEAEIFNFLS